MPPKTFRRIYTHEQVQHCRLTLLEMFYIDADLADVRVIGAPVIDTQRNLFTDTITSTVTAFID